MAAHHRGGHVPPVQPGHRRPDGPRHRRGRHRAGALGPGPATVRREKHLLQLPPHPLPPGHQPGRGRGPPGGRRHPGGLPAGALPAGQRPAAPRHPRLHRGTGHPAGPRHRAGPARGGDAGPGAGHQCPAAAPGTGHPEGPRPAPGAVARGGLLGSDRAGRGGPAGRAAARPAGRPPGPGRCSPVRWAISGTAVIPIPLVLLAIPVTWLLAIIIAIGPGRAAARITPATVLRTE